MIPVYLESFSYRHGLPDFADQVIDMRFAKNPHWVNSLREKTGLDEEVANLLIKDEAAETVLENFKQILDTTLSRMQEDGRPKLTLAFGCTGGKIDLSGQPRRLRLLKAEGTWFISGTVN